MSVRFYNTWTATALCCALWLAVGTVPWIPAQAAGSTSTNDAQVVIIHDPLATEAFRPSFQRIQAMLERGLTAVTGKSRTKEAWLSLVSTQDIIGIKVYSAPGLAGSRVEVVAAMVQSMIEAGIPAQNLVVWDKLASDLQSSGFTDLTRRFPIKVTSCYEAGYDETAAYTNFYLGRLTWTDHEFGKTATDVGKRSFFSKLLTKQLTKIINVAPLSNHYRAGVTGCLFSLAMGSVDNTQRFESSPENLASAVPEIYAQDPIYEKVILHIVDALLAQYQGESQTFLHYTRPLNELRFSRDGLALDQLSLKDLAELRQMHSVLFPTNVLTSINKLYNENAPLMDLGQADPKRIHIERR